MRRLAPAVLAASVLLAACGGDGASDVEATTVAPATIVAAEDAVEPAATTDSGATDAADDAPPTTATGGPLAAPLELDPCLVGTWDVSLETIGLLVAAAVLPVPDLTVPRGGFTVVLGDDGTVSGEADFTGAFTLGETPAEADVAWSGSGTWSTLDGTVTLALDQQEGGLVEVRLGGEAQPGSQMAADLPLAGGPYTCTDTRLEVTGSTGDTTVPLVFER